MLVKLSIAFSVLGAIFLIAACYLWIQERRLLAEAGPAGKLLCWVMIPIKILPQLLYTACVTVIVSLKA